MHREELLHLLRARPCRVDTTDWTPTLIGHPDFACLTPDGRTLHVYQRDNTYDMLDVVLIPRFGFEAPPEAAGPSAPAGPPAAQA